MHLEMTLNMIYIVALGVGFKCPCKIHLNTQWGGLLGQEIDSSSSQCTEVGVIIFENKALTSSLKS